MNFSNTRGQAGGGVTQMRHSAPGGPGVAVDIERFCPECGAAMIEFDRLAEDGAVFIWYACSQENCTGQWLTKKALRMGGS